MAKRGNPKTPHSLITNFKSSSLSSSSTCFSLSLSLSLSFSLSRAFSLYKCFLYQPLCALNLFDESPL
ncbi:hypothetical protein ACSBR1_021362 [Camellia fascicularis]